MEEIEVISNSEREPNLLKRICEHLNKVFQNEFKGKKESFEYSFNRVCLETAEKFNCNLDLGEGKFIFISNNL